jgi:molybdopterin molybdotransferase
MDGFAVRSADVSAATPASPVRLARAGHVLIGELSTRVLQPGECLEIATGAPVPAGADAVVMVERTTRDGDVVLVHEGAVPGQNIGRRGADVSVDDVVVQPRDYLTPARAGVLAAIGATDVAVFTRPRVAILSSGPEVVAAGRPLLPGQIYDVNAVTLHAVVSQHGGIALPAPPVADSVEALTAALVAAAAEDIIVCSGGSSVGRKDLLIDALAQCGTLTFHGIAVKPGKPTLFGYVGTTPLFGMPGNPTSCLSNAYLLLVPFLRATAGLPPRQATRVQATLARRITSNAGRHQFYTVRLSDGEAQPVFKSSGDITSMADADGYIEIPADVSVVEAGQAVLVTLF